MNQPKPHAPPSPPAPNAERDGPSGRPSSPKRRRTGPSPTSADLTLDSTANVETPANVPQNDSESSSIPEIQRQPLRVLEFYSGIGGMHYALKDAGIDAQIVAAFEVFDVANSVYNHNFGKGIVKQGLLEAHKPADFAKTMPICGPCLNHLADLQSPPCQPYTRQLSANQLGASDPRSKSFLYLLDVLRSLPAASRPRYLLVENVKGFDESLPATCSCARLLTSVWRAQLAVAVLSCGQAGCRVQVAEVTAAEFPEAKATAIEEEKEEQESGKNQARPLTEYLEPAKDDPQAWKDAVVWKRTPLFDIVTPSSRRSCCFTKNYTTYFEGTGSILQESDHLDVKAIWPEFLARQPAALAQIERKEPVTDVENPLLPLRLRFFSPREVANLMCFPPEFEFPKGISEKQKYRLLGNSINVLVVGKVMQFMLDMDR
ncbi:S-adenosyl-L-methionine-dependent methyltransferase [Catenaria anguillulae PL171]|uniref:tRNA (cytosine(38)-C(5))-methyltransferase n=1 Tax=Catenaria anguillulae PL171 TaxID=765915 RepID=A0A1Y2HDN7_9FUNG|nr:S-adenosyl-L-methionine-dependent methyltransferase [Catenaria anguillulae PL171]